MNIEHLFSFTGVLVCLHIITTRSQQKTRHYLTVINDTVDLLISECNLTRVAEDTQKRNRIYFMSADGGVDDHIKSFCVRIWYISVNVVYSLWRMSSGTGARPFSAHNLRRAANEAGVCSDMSRPGTITLPDNVQPMKIFSQMI